jgi:regulatory protein
MLYLDYKKSVYSKRKIIQDLYTKGISKELIDEAFMESDFSEDDSISSVLKKRAKRYDLSDSKDLQKLYRYLVGKGYSFSTVKKAVDNYILEQKNSFYE